RLVWPLDQRRGRLLTSGARETRRRILRCKRLDMHGGIMQALVRVVVAALLALFASAAYAAYPERPITLIVPWGAGGGTDAVARFFGSYLEKELGQPVNVVNRTGGNGVVGHSAIAQAAADGYTLGLLTVAIS